MTLAELSTEWFDYSCTLYRVPSLQLRFLISDFYWSILGESTIRMTALLKYLIAHSLYSCFLLYNSLMFTLFCKGSLQQVAIFTSIFC